MRIESCELTDGQIHDIQCVVNSVGPHPYFGETVNVFTKDGNVIFLSEKGFRFRTLKTDIVSTVVAEIKTPLNCLCSGFVIDEEEVAPSILEKLVERHGAKLARTVESVIIYHKDETLMLLNLPSGIVRHMMSPSGGVMRTNFSGPTTALRHIPTFANYGHLPDDAPTYKGCIATEYKAGALYSVLGFHHNILKEVIAHPGLGITLERIGTWDA